MSDGKLPDLRPMWGWLEELLKPEPIDLNPVESDRTTLVEDTAEENVKPISWDPADDVPKHFIKVKIPF